VAQRDRPFAAVQGDTRRPLHDPSSCVKLHIRTQIDSKREVMLTPMNFNNPIFWSFVVTICSIVLLTEAALLFHVLFVTRQRLWRYLLVIILVEVSLWSFAVAFDTSNKFEYLSLVTHVHINRAWWLATISPLIHALQLQIGLTIATCALMLLIRSMVFPRTDRPPVWVIVKERLFSANL
jgi:hypothetical protein